MTDTDYTRFRAQRRHLMEIIERARAERMDTPSLLLLLGALAHDMRRLDISMRAAATPSEVAAVITREEGETLP